MVPWNLLPNLELETHIRIKREKYLNFLLSYEEGRFVGWVETFHCRGMGERLVQLGMDWNCRFLTLDQLGRDQVQCLL